MDIRNDFSGDEGVLKGEKAALQQSPPRTTGNDIWGAYSFVLVCFVYEGLYEARWGCALGDPNSPLRKELGQVLEAREGKRESILGGLCQTGLLVQAAEFREQGLLGEGRWKLTQLTKD